MRVSRLITNRRLFVLLGSIILVIVIGGLTLGTGSRSATWPERIIIDTQNTVGSWLYRPVSKLTAFLGGVHDLRNMYQENAQLKSELENYAQLQVQLEEAQSTNAQLEQMLKFKNSNQLGNYRLVPARVIGRDPSQWSSEVSIDLGIGDGIHNNAPVVAPDGSLVGKVLQAGNHSSKVILITDTQVGDGVAAKILSSNNPGEPPYGIVVGAPNQPGKLQMTFLSPMLNIDQGNTVVTSGLGGIYPAGLIIGTVDSVGSDAQGLSQTAVLTPAADFDYLEDVFVVLPKGKSS